MTKEQSEAIEYFMDRIKDATPRYTEILVDGKIIKEEVYPIKMRFDQEDAEKMKTVLNMLKEKDKEIEKYKNLLASNLAKELNNSIKAKEKADTDLDDLDKGWKVELEKKDKMIDLTLEFLAERDLGYYQKEEGGEIQGIFRKYNKDDWKQYFERKEENV